ncbi:hypothetical protein Ocin01_07233 [Orchesella cincta]|uniref:Uncharacterized protein n=1 Tax=Orchesella cincta TaxID=48709 RepID=A0A1D2N3E7_ORCCI|nr:hypothetical protein Ocin01_07233 [Orchesella cincta]
MASGGDALIGADPQTENEFQKEAVTEIFDSPWAYMPSPVFRQLISKMGSHFNPVARQVCISWLAYVDNEIGLSVKVDDTLPGNLEFVQSVKVAQARIVKWHGISMNMDSLPDCHSSLNNDFALFQFPTCLQKLTLTGKMPEQWTFRNLSQFPNLTHLVLRGASMHLQDMTGNPLPEPAFSPENPLSQNYQQYEPVVGPPVWMKKLAKLELIMNEFSYPSGLPLSVRLREPERALQHERHCQHLYHIVVNNATFILTNLRSNALKAAQLYIYPKAGIIPPTSINWRHLPLQKFLAHHRATLKELYLPEFEGKFDTTGVDIAGYSICLRKLQLELRKYIGDREQNFSQNSSYWQNLLMNQTRLVDLELSLADFPISWIDETLHSLAFSCKETLNFVDIAIEVADEPARINLELFTYCHNLEILKLSGKDHPLVAVNFCKLPESLKKIKLASSLLEIPDPEQIDKYTKLEMLELFTITILNGDHNLERTSQLALKLVQLRGLNYLSVSFDSPWCSGDSDIYTGLQSLDRDYMSVSVFCLKMNLIYELDHGWGDERFDIDKNQVECFNTREPEDYPTWHRNAISVDDEDHRLLIFHTLPFLLDLRERRRSQRFGDDEENNDADDDDSDSDDLETVVSNGSNLDFEDWDRETD